MADVADPIAALRRTASVGGFFVVGTDLESSEILAWHPFSILLDPTSGAAADLIASVRVALARGAGQPVDAVEPRVAASLWLLGWAHRLVSPWLGAVVLGGVHVRPTAGGLRWRPAAGQPVPLAVTRAAGVAVHEATPPEVASLFRDDWLDRLLTPLVDIGARSHHVSRRVLWGNVGSAVAGAGAALGRSHPAYGERVASLVDAVLSLDELRGTGTFAVRRGSGGRSFGRTTCCLLYRVPTAGLCADCVLAAH